MCGRYSQTAPPETIAKQFALDKPPPFTPRYNIAPSQAVLIVRMVPGSRHREGAMLRWGLIPSWATGPAIGGGQLINARAETAATKPAFRGPIRKQRCLIPATGFYEWKREGRTSQPFLVQLRTGAPFAFAGLWDWWVPKGGQAVESCMILTTGPNAIMEPIHYRMPVILGPQDYGRWLDPAVQAVDAIQPLFKPYPADEMTAYPVSPLVNNPRYDSPACLEPVT